MLVGDSNMRDVICFEKILSDEINAEVLQDVKNSVGWKIAYDFCDQTKHSNLINDPTLKSLDITAENYSSDSGHILSTYQIDKTKIVCPTADKLNVYAEIILNVCLARANKYGLFFKDASLIRVFWNYYSSSSYGSLHKDVGNWDVAEMANLIKDKKNSWYSLVYYLNTCENSGTKVLDDNDYTKYTLYPSIQGNGILFPSDKMHGGTGAPHMKQRYCLNVMFEAELIERK